MFLHYNYSPAPLETGHKMAYLPLVSDYQKLKTLSMEIVMAMSQFNLKEMPYEVPSPA